MKIKKILPWVLPLLVVITLVILTFLSKKSDEDPTKKLISENNYPYSGVYSENSQILTEADLTEFLVNVPEIAQYTDNLSVAIHADNTVVLSGNITNTQELFAKVKQLSAFKIWASAFDGQKVSITAAAFEDENKNLAIEPSSISIGSIKLDPKLLTSALGSVDQSKWLGSLPYRTVVFSEGSVLFSGSLPEFLKQS